MEKGAINGKGKNGCYKQRKVDLFGVEITCNIYEHKKDNTCPKRFDDIADCLPGHLVVEFFPEDKKKRYKIKKGRDGGCQ